MSGTSGAYFRSVQRALLRLDAPLLRRFEEQSTDAERMRVVLQFPALQDAFQLDDGLASGVKDSDRARALRESGNALYGRVSYADALQSYSEAARYAPAEGCDELSLAYANRSAASFKLERFAAAVADIEHAFRNNYPERLEYKLLERQIRCLVHLRRVPEARSVLARLAAALENSSLDEIKRATMTKELTELVAGGEETEHASGDGKSSRGSSPGESVAGVPKVAVGVHERFSCASAKINFLVSEDFGRHAVAVTNILPGDVLLVERPYVNVLAFEKRESYCHHCVCALTVVVPCRQCTYVSFCSEACRSASWSEYHKVECRYVESLSLAGIGLIGPVALRLVVKTGVDRIRSLTPRLARIESSPEVPILVGRDGLFVGGFESLYTLYAHGDSRNAHELLQYAVLATYLLRILRHANFCERRDEVLVGGVLLRFLQIIACNGVEAMETTYEGNVQRSQQESLGLSLYPTVSMLNHSCNPVCELIFYGNTCAVRAVRSVVSEDPDVTIDYGYVYYLSDRQQRNLALQAQYFFRCHCEACRLRWPLRAALPSGIPTLKCVRCGDALERLHGDCPSDQTLVVCANCGLSQRPIKALELIQQSSLRVEKTLNGLRIDIRDGATNVLRSHVSMLERNITLPTKDFVAALSALKQCFRLEGNVRVVPTST